MEFDKKTIRNVMLLAIAIIVAFQVSDNVTSILSFINGCFQVVFPFLLGLGLAFILNVPLRFFERQIERLCRGRKTLLYKKRRIVSFLLTICAVLGVIALVMLLVIPQMTVTVSQIIEQIPKFTRTVSGWLRDLQERIPQLKNTIGNLEEGWDVIGKALSKLSSTQIAGMFSSTVGIISNAISGVVSFFIAFVFACYVLFQKETLSEQCKKLLFGLFPVKTADRLLGMARLANSTFSKFMVGQCLEAAILSLMFIVTMSVLRMPYAVMIGCVIGILSLVPIVGAFVGCFIGAFLILMVSPVQALIFVGVFLILQQIEGNLVYPHVVGNSVGLPSIWVLVAVTLGGNLLGVAGMIIGIPIVSMIYVMLAKYINVKLMVKQIPEYKWRNREFGKETGKQRSRRHYRNSSQKHTEKECNEKA